MRLGNLPLYNEANWASYAIDQGVMLCDKLLIIEGSQFVAFPDIPERSDDGTLDIISDKQKQYPGRIEVRNTIRKHRNYRINQSDNYNVSLQHCEIGDYFVILAGDSFMLDDFIPKANQLMKKGEMDYLAVESLKFCFGFKWAFNISPAYRILKKIPSLCFRPTTTPIGFGSKGERFNGVSHHHYTWVKPRARMRTRMRTSGFYPGILEWFDKNWDSIELGEGKTLQFLKKSYILKRYDGEHPSLLDNHPWRHVEDIRKLKQ